MGKEINGLFREYLDWNEWVRLGQKEKALYVNRSEFPGIKEDEVFFFICFKASEYCLTY